MFYCRRFDLVLQIHVKSYIQALNKFRIISLMEKGKILFFMQDYETFRVP